MNDNNDPATETVAVPFPQDRTCPYRPAPGYEPLRTNPPLSTITLYDGREAWLVTGHEEGRALLADPRLSSDWIHPSFPVIIPRFDDTPGSSFPLIGVDDPEHARQRRMLIPSFGIKRMNTMRPILQQETDELLDTILADGPVADLVQAFALPVPSKAICNLLGVPYEDHELFEERSRDVVGAVTPAETDSAFAELYGYLYGLVEKKQKVRGDGLLDELIVSHVEQGQLDIDELAKMALVLLVAGHETSANAIALGILTLLEHPDQLEALREDPTLISGTIDEILRFLAVSDFIVRLAAEDIEVGGRTIKAGDGVVLSLMLMNRDDRAYPDADTFDIRRSARKHVGFGHGIHQCIGQNLARMEIEIALTSLFSRIPTLRLAVPADKIPIRPGHDGQGPLELPVTW